MSDTDARVSSPLPHTPPTPVRPPTPLLPPTPVRLASQDIVAGAAAAGHGVLLSWQGSNELSLGVLREILGEAGCPIDWAPRSHSTHRYLGRAVQALNGRGYTARALRKVDGTQATYRARWQVGGITAADAGEAYGMVVLTVTLSKDNTYEIVGDPALSASLREAVEDDIASETLSSTDVTYWLRSIISEKFGGIRLGQNYYIPRAHVALAENLCTKLSRRWGASWMLPALPIATTTQLTEGIARSLATEIGEISIEVEKTEHLSSRLAARLLSDIEALAERVRGYGPLIGDINVRGLVTHCSAVSEKIRLHLSDTTQRGVAIWDEVSH